MEESKYTTNDEAIGGCQAIPLKRCHNVILDDSNMNQILPPEGFRSILNFDGDFTCQTGVRQGENLSPLLFVIFLCDPI